MPDVPRVFISYTHESVEHANRVLQLANRLRCDGVDADVDQYHHSPPEGWPRWMEERISWANYVFIIVSPTYLARVTGREEPGKGLGVRWEGNLIYQHLYQAGANNTKFIPVGFTHSDLDCIPTPLQGATHYLMDDGPSDEYEAILRRCQGLPRNEKPLLGGEIALPPKERKTNVGMFYTSFINLDIWHKAVWAGCAYFHDEKLREPPRLGLLFRDKNLAEQIFREWRERLGPTDSFNELRIAIVEGDIDQKRRGGYGVHIGSNVENIYKRADAEGIDIPRPHVMTVSEIHYMTPGKGSTNLSVFQKRFEQFGSFLLLPMIQEGEMLIPGEGLAIHKRNIEFRKMSDITSPNDPDAIFVPRFAKQEKP